MSFGVMPFSYCSTTRSRLTRLQEREQLIEKLIAAGFPIEGGADGKFGTHTEDAVRAFQTAHPPLPANGVADEATQSALGS